MRDIVKGQTTEVRRKCEINAKCHNAFCHSLTDPQVSQDVNDERRHLWELAHDPGQTLLIWQEQLLVPLLS